MVGREQPEKTPPFDPYNNGKRVYGDVRANLDYEDAFQNQVANRTNVLDLAAHYPYNQERWRLFVDGDRLFPEYGSVSQYNHAADRHELSPASGETVVFQSAERPRYVVQYELAATFAFTVNQSLSGDDTIKIGLYDGSDGWYIEHNGSHPDAQTGDAVMERNGSVVYRESDIDLAQPVTKFARLKLQTGWYNTTRQTWERSFPTTDGEQRNATIASVGAPDNQGPRTGNLPIHFEVTAGASTTDLVLDAGSAAQVNLGQTTKLTRNKQTIQTESIDSTDTWVPLQAIRIDPDRDIVNVQFAELRVLEYSTNDDVELLAIASAKQNVLDGDGNELTDADYSTPNETLASDSVAELSSAVAEFPDATGATTTTATNPGGYQVSHADLSTASGNATASAAGPVGEPKRPIFGQDTVVLLGKSPSTGDVRYEMTFEEDW